MSIAIDGIVFSLQRAGGISVYFQELLRVLGQRGDAATLTLETPHRQELLHPSSSVAVHPIAARRLERYRAARVPMPSSVFHSSYYRRPDQPGVPTVVTVYDFIYERFRTGPARWAHTAQKNAAIRSAQAVICISESTRQDMLQWIGETPGQQVHVVHCGVGEGFHPLGLERSGPPALLYIGERGGYKNFRLALQALALLPDCRLDCVGGGPLRPEELAEFPPAVRDRVRHLGFVTDEQLNERYNQAACLVYPSSYEGFGIPPLEAMRAGCPVVCIECAAVLEIGAGALTIAESAEPDALARAIARTLEPAYRADIVARGLAVSARYSWREAHARTLEIYGTLADVARPAR